MTVKPIYVLAATLAFGVPALSAAPAQRPPEKPMPERARRPKVELKIKGGKATPVKGRRAGHPLGKLPGAKSISFAQWRDMKDIPATGLFLVETDFVPYNLPARLKKEGLTLTKDGKLRDKKGPVTLFVASEAFQAELNAKQSLLDKASGLFMGTAHAASPYPFSRFTWSMWWRYRGGFCRDYRAWTVAEAWGPEQDGARPHTRIEYMETRAEIGSRRDRDSCSNCDEESSYARWDIGCWWPAHGGASGWHYANWKDGWFSATRTWSW